MKRDCLIYLFAAFFALTNICDLSASLVPGWTMCGDEDDDIIDSIRASAPKVIECRLDSATIAAIKSAEADSLSKGNGMKSGNTHVPTSFAIDRTKSVGDISIFSGTSQTGAKTYEIPISVYPGKQKFTPELKLSYNSQRGNSVVGMGWELLGLSMITRGAKSMYYDNAPQGVAMDNNDAFYLDGIRLIKTSQTSAAVNFQSETGNIQVKAYKSGTVIKYFEVFYPNGTKGVYGYTNNTSNKLFYPLVTFSDSSGNTISYEYTETNNIYHISTISYNGAFINFSYVNRPSTLQYNLGGVCCSETKLLSEIICRFGSQLIGRYQLDYITQNRVSLLSEVGYYTVNGSLNPIRFYYGEGIADELYCPATTALRQWFVSNNPNVIKIVRGKFDNYSDDDGLLELPQKNPYVKYYRDSDAGSHSANRFINEYYDDEKILIYTGLNQSVVYPTELYTEENFIDILCADLSGCREDYVVKINNGVDNGMDVVTFKVYCSNYFNSLSCLYSRSYSFSTTYEDHRGYKSIQPKYYYSGDFNGDGKMEILAVSAHQPLGSGSASSGCYLFDLVNDQILYQGYMFQFNVMYEDNVSERTVTAENNTDKLLVFDYDGDGKTDICHVSSSGTKIYTFNCSGSTVTGYTQLASYPSLTRSNFADRQYSLGDFNGDALADIIISPISGSNSDNTWKIYSSKGGTGFNLTTFTGPYNRAGTYSGFVTHDINGDGQTDLIDFNNQKFNTYLTDNNLPVYCADTTYFSTSYSRIVPTDINSRDRFAQILAWKDSLITKYSFSRNDRTEQLLTGAVNSYGIIEKNEYAMIDGNGISSGVYQLGGMAEFPYLVLQDRLPVIASSKKYYNNALLENYCFDYIKAVMHRQGLGFCGFERIGKNDIVRNIYNTQTFDPYRRGLLTKEESQAYRNEYTYNYQIQSNRIAKITLSGKVENDLLKSITATTTITSDSYGFPTSETTSYTGGITITKNTTYSHRNTVAAKYCLGRVSQQITTVTKNGTSYVEKVSVPSYNDNNKPNSRISYVNGGQVSRYSYTYDSYGNTLTETLNKYSSATSTQTTYQYDNYGRPTKVTDPLGLTNEFTYDSSYGRLASFKDQRGKISQFTYDYFGREISAAYPDTTTTTTTYSWLPEGSTGLYSVAVNNTVEPETTVWYDAFNREVKECAKRFNGSIIKTEKQYDAFGNLTKVSLPYNGSSPSYWNNYTYDRYGRPLSYAEASGRSTTYSYSGNSVTTSVNGVSTIHTYDALGNLVSVDDASGTITYNVAADGNPITIVAPGNVTTTFTYDNFRRRTGITDPSSGTTSYTYDAAGNVASETNANSETIQYSYDTYGRITGKTLPEFSVTYTYNSYGDLSQIAATNGAASIISYDTFGRVSSISETSIGNKSLTRNFIYSRGQLSSTRYTLSSGTVVTENYTYANGHHTETKLNGTSIFKLSAENGLGLPTLIKTGDINRIYNYNAYGFPTLRYAAYSSNALCNLTTTFNSQTHNLESRKDNIRNLTESFSYDSQDRLTSFASKNVSYNAKGNILSKGDVGSFQYEIADKPYALTRTVLSDNAIAARTQDISYTSFQRPDMISENGYIASFDYDGGYDRSRMVVTQNGSNILTRHYLGDCYEIDETGTSTKEKLYLGGDYYNAYAVYVKEGGTGTIYYIIRDHLGSIMRVAKTNGTGGQELSYDAWGRLRNPANQTVYAPDQEPALFLGRGYTGHEHLPWFGLINMNARLYDPALGRFLSPDPYVRMPDNSQNFNRYSYAMNNPLRYTDESGLFYKEDEAKFYSMLHGSAKIDYDPNRQEWYVCMDEFGTGPYISGPTMTRVFSFYDLPWDACYIDYYENYFTYLYNNYDYNPQGYGKKNSPKNINDNSVLPYINDDIRSLCFARFDKFVQEYDQIKTRDKSRIADKINKEYKKLTGKKLGKPSDLYKYKFPKQLNNVSLGLGFMSLGIDVVSPVLKREFKYSDLLNISVDGISFIPKVGYIIVGCYCITDIGIVIGTGNSIGDYLDNYIEEEGYNPVLFNFNW